MKKFLTLLITLLLPISPLSSAESPETLVQEIASAFAHKDSASLATRRYYGLLTGDLPIIAGRLPDHLLAEVRDMKTAIPTKYDLESVKLASEEDRQFLDKPGRSHLGYIRVDFRRNDPNVQMTAFARMYPFAKIDGGFFLLTRDAKANPDRLGAPSP